MPPQSQRRIRHYRARRTTTTTTMSGSTVSNSQSSLSTTPISPNLSANPSTGFGFSSNSSSSTVVFGGAPSFGFQSANSFGAVSFSPFPPSSSPVFGGSGLFGSSTGTTNTASSIFGSSDSSSGSTLASSNPVGACSPKTIPVPSNYGSAKHSAGSETPVHEKSVIEEEGSCVPNQEAISKMEDFDGITLAADKSAILLRIQSIHPSCLPSLRLRSKPHRRSAYDHLVQLIHDLKAIGGDGDPNSYAELVPSLDDLEFYGFELTWLRDLVVQLQKNAERRREKEAKRKAREELLKQIEAIDAELANTEDPPTGSMESLSALLESP